MRTIQHKLTGFTGNTDVRISIFGQNRILEKPEEEEVKCDTFSISRPWHQIAADGLFSSLLKQTVLQKIVYLRRNIKGTDLIFVKMFARMTF